MAKSEDMKMAKRIKDVVREYHVKQKDIAEIMNRINRALEGTKYQAVGYDNTGVFLNVMIEEV